MLAAASRTAADHPGLQRAADPAARLDRQQPAGLGDGDRGRHRPERDRRRGRHHQAVRQRLAPGVRGGDDGPASCGFLAAMGALSVGRRGGLPQRGPGDPGAAQRGRRRDGRGVPRGPARSTCRSATRRPASATPPSSSASCSPRSPAGRSTSGPWSWATCSRAATRPPFDRAHAARPAAHCIDWLTGRILAGRADWHYATLIDGKLGSARIVQACRGLRHGEPPPEGAVVDCSTCRVMEELK